MVPAPGGCNPASALDAPLAKPDERLKCPPCTWITEVALQRAPCWLSAVCSVTCSDGTRLTPPTPCIPTTRTWTLSSEAGFVGARVTSTNGLVTALSLQSASDVGWAAFGAPQCPLLGPSTSGDLACSPQGAKLVALRLGARGGSVTALGGLCGTVPAPASSCALCSLPLRFGGCKCDGSPDCRCITGGPARPCDKCTKRGRYGRPGSPSYAEGGCKCDSACNCVNPCEGAREWYETTSNECFDVKTTCPAQFGFKYRFYMCGPRKKDAVCLRKTSKCPHPYALFDLSGTPYAFQCYEPYPCGYGPDRNPACSRTALCFRPEDGFKRAQDYITRPTVYSNVSVVYLDTPAGAATLVTASFQDAVAPPHSPDTWNCTDGLLNGLESDVDCGGLCPLCAAGQRCNSELDCQNHVCGGDGYCAEPSCYDGVLNGAETGLDCGGGCPGCSAGSFCLSPADCATNNCTVTQVCGTPRPCENKVKDGLETGVDCGGPDCPACANGQPCQVDTDCESLFCGPDYVCAPICGRFLYPCCGGTFCQQGTVCSTTSGICDIVCGQEATPCCSLANPCSTGLGCVDNICQSSTTVLPPPAVAPPPDPQYAPPPPPCDPSASPSPCDAPPPPPPPGYQ